MDQRRLHLQAEVCFSSPLDSYPVPSLFLFHGVTVAGRAYWPLVLNESRRLYPFLLLGSTSADLVTQAGHAGAGIHDASHGHSPT